MGKTVPVMIDVACTATPVQHGIVQAFTPAKNTDSPETMDQPKPSRVVLDTNIVMDLLHFSDRHTLPLQTAIGNGQLLCITDAPCLAELERVSHYPEFALDGAARQALIDNYLTFVEVCNAAGEEDFDLPRCRDKDDQKFLILAARGRADLLVTRDKLLLRLARHRHKPPPFAILTAVASCQLLGLL